MIRRVLVVAEREFRETVFRRAFLMVLLAPVGMLVGIGALGVLVGVLVPLLVSHLDRPAPTLPVLEVCAPSLVRPLADTLETWRVEPCGVPDAEVVARVSVDERGELRVRSRRSDGVAALASTVREVALRERLVASGVDRSLIDGSDPVVVVDPWPSSLSVAQARGRVLGFGLAACWLVVLLVGGQQMLVSTLEEKGNRVIEVLLGAVDPAELLVGKITGQLGVACLLGASWVVPLGALAAVLGTWVVGPIAAVEVSLFVVADLVGWMALSAGIGSLMSDLGEARQASGRAVPLLLLLFGVGAGVAMFPDEPVARVLAVLPPTCAIAMPVALVSETPPPQWQVAVAMSGTLAVVGLASWVGRWAFRVGLLLRSRPPDLRTLLRWLRTS